jgi:predicted nucleotidyltransferase
VRPPAQPSSFFYHPLDTVLGTPAAVRILRVLANHSGALSRSTIAERARLTPAGAARTIDRLVAMQIVTPAGDPRRPHYALVDHPLAVPLRQLYRAEAARTDRFIELVREEAQALSPSPAGVWLIGSVARREDDAGSDVDVAVVWRGATGARLKTFNRAVHDAGLDAGYTPSIVRLSLGELIAHAKADDAWWRNLVRDAVPIAGRAPKQLVARPVPKANWEGRSKRSVLAVGRGRSPASDTPFRFAHSA